MHQRRHIDLAVDDDRGLLHGTNREDRDLWRIDHGDELLHAEHAEVRDREGAAIHVLACQLALAGATYEIGAGAGDLLHAATVGVADDRHNEAVRSRNGHADVRPGMTVNLLTGERRVDGAVPHERDAHKTGEKVVDGRLHIALGQARDELLAEMQRLRHIDRDSELEDRCRPCLGKSARNRLADRSHGDDLDFFGQSRQRGLLHRGRRATTGRGVPDVLGDDAAVRPRPRERREVDAALARDPPGQRRRLDPPALGHHDRACRASVAARRQRSRL